VDNSAGEVQPCKQAPQTGPGQCETTTPTIRSVAAEPRHRRTQDG
jgi:hypothetical protein